MKRVLSWLKANSVMLINSGSLVGTTLITSFLGFVYWWVAARRFSPDTVGTGSAAISSMTLIGTFCVLGLGTLLITEIPRQPKLAVPLISTSLAVVAVAGGLVGLLFALIAPIFSNQFSYLNASTVDVISYAIGVSLTSVTLVLDQALIGLLLGVQQFHRNALFSVVKLLALLLVSFLLSKSTGMNVYATWSLGNLLSLVILIPKFLKSKKTLRSYLPQWKLLQQMSGTALQHHLLNTMVQFTGYALPTIVTVLLSARMNALFYVSWMLVNFIFYIPTALTVVLHAMNSAQQSTLAQRARMTLSVALITCIIAAIVLQFATNQILGVFGHTYVDGAWILRILVLAALPIIIKNHYLSICRIQDRVKNAVRIIGPGCVLELVLAITGARLGGLLGLSLGWVIATYLEAICMSPTVYKAIFTSSHSISTEESFIDTSAEAIWLVDTLVHPVIDASQLPTIKLSKQKNAQLEEYQQLFPTGHESSNNMPRLKPLRLERLSSSSLSSNETFDSLMVDRT